MRDFIVSSYEKRKSSLCAQDVENLRDWPVDDKMFDEVNHLTDEGRQEIFEIGERLIQAFPKLLANLDRGKFIIRAASDHWIIDSAESFVKGLKNKNVFVEEPKTEFDILAPYVKCAKYQTEVRNNPNTYIEAFKYWNSLDYLAAKDRIQRRIGTELTNENITSLYDLCRFTWSGIHNKVSPWCALFTTDDLKVLEYIGDLRHYYRNGYGTPTNELFGRIPMADLLQKFEEAKGDEGKKIVAYFSHASIIDMIYTALGLFKDERSLTGAQRQRDRKWRTSILSGFAANIMAVLNRCTENNTDDVNVVFYLNEEPLRSICKDGVCSWQEFEAKLTPFVNTTIDFC